MVDNDAYSWTEDRIKTEIQSLLPEGWSFQFRYDEIGYWNSKVLEPNGAVAWEDSFPASNVLLLNAYGWLALRRSTRQVGTWGRRRDLTLAEVNADALRKSSSPDPADVDPSEIASVYKRVHLK